VLFGAAALPNLGVTMSALKKFGQASGLEINISKSWLTFPKSLHHRLRKILSHSVHIPATTSFGKYLGIPLFPINPRMPIMKIF